MTKITLDCRRVIVLDWNDNTHWNGGRQAPCIHCHQPALLLDDARRQHTRSARNQRLPR